MANTAYICRVRTDIPAGTAQITDLHPNTSQASAIYSPNTQSGYMPLAAQNDTLAALVANNTVAAYSGLAAYLIDNVIDNVSNVTITVTVANAAAILLLADKDAATALTAANINAQLVAGGAGAGTEIAANGSTGSVKDVLKICAGGRYSLPKGSTVGALAAGAELGMFNNDTFRQLYVTGSLQISCGVGVCFTLASATYSYKGIAGRAITVYDYAGNVLA